MFVARFNWMGIAAVAGPAVMLALLLATVAAPASADSISTELSPSATTVNKTTCFKAKATTSNDTPVADAHLRLGNESVKTNSNGNAKLCANFRRSGAHVARVQKRGYRSGQAIVSAAKQPRAGADWHIFRTLLWASDDLHPEIDFCFGLFGREDGVCHGYFLNRGDLLRSPFKQSPQDGFGLVRYIGQRPTSIKLVNYQGGPGPFQGAPYLAGWIPSENSGAFTVTSGAVPQWGATNITSGTDQSTPGKQGSALAIDVQSRDCGGANVCYSIEIAGYLRY